jgi:hypothetical protein
MRQEQLPHGPNPILLALVTFVPFLEQNVVPFVESNRSAKTRIYFRDTGDVPVAHQLGEGGA